MKRVVITGIGLVTPLGNDTGTTWDRLTKGISGIGTITRFDARSRAFPSKIAGELKNFSPGQYIPRKDMLRLDPFVHYATAAAIMAAEDAGLISRRGGDDPPSTHSFQPKPLGSAGVVIGSSRGGITSIERACERYTSEGRMISPYLMPSSTISMASSYVSMRLGIRGPAIGISTACASGTNAIGEAMKLIRHGEVGAALAGGTEAPICKLAIGGYGTAGALSRRNDAPEEASRPFDRERDGFVVAEGAGVLVLEELGLALKRGARIYAELAGYGTSSDAFHQTRPDSGGEAMAIRKALRDAGISIEDVDYINAHATSTVPGDRAEARAIRSVFGKRTGEIPVSSCKSMMGHMLGGAGAVEAAVTALMIDRTVIIPTRNIVATDPDCHLNHVTEIAKKPVRAALSNSFGFGGVNAVVVLKKL